jgi:prepilin-type N-terminal cleavage/methylation domain-containing protein
VRRDFQHGITLIEMMIVVVIVGIMAGIAAPSFRTMQTDQAVRSSARETADAFMLARAQSIRTNSNIIVVFQNATGVATPGGISSTNAIDIINDGVATTADCAISSSTAEIIWSVQPVSGLNWGTTPGLAGTTNAPGDTGFGPSNSDKGSSFTDATVTTTTVNSSKFASWVVFQPDGIPRLMTPGDCANLGNQGQGGGAIYITNGRRDYAVVLSPLGTARVHRWNGGGWTQ